jgi:hypothetical protein
MEDGGTNSRVETNCGKEDWEAEVEMTGCCQRGSGENEDLEWE